MSERLEARDWIDFALATLAREGFPALKADVLARKLGVSRGSFYWHFINVGAFHDRLIERWREAATEAIIAGLEKHASPESRLDALLRRAFAHRGTLEIRMRTWAEHHAGAARAIAEIDRRRREYIEQLLKRAGVAPSLAATRAQVLYWTYLGAALSRERLGGARLSQFVAELAQIGLGDPAAEPGALPSGRHGAAG